MGSVSCLAKAVPTPTNPNCMKLGLKIQRPRWNLLLTATHSGSFPWSRFPPSYPHICVLTLSLKCFTYWTSPTTQTKCSRQALPNSFHPTTVSFVLRYLCKKCKGGQSPGSVQGMPRHQTVSTKEFFLPQRGKQWVVRGGRRLQRPQKQKQVQQARAGVSVGF